LENTIVPLHLRSRLSLQDAQREYKTLVPRVVHSHASSAVRPGFDGRGAVAQLVSTVDLAPTLLDAAASRAREMSGRSLVRLLRERDATSWPEEVFVQISEAQTGRAVRTQRWKYSVARRPTTNPWARVRLRGLRG